MPFHEIIKRSIGENKSIVVSIRDDGRISIAQQILAVVDDKQMEFFMKNAIIITKDGLDDLIDALEEARQLLVNKEENK